MIIIIITSVCVCRTSARVSRPIPSDGVPRSHVTLSRTVAREHGFRDAEYLHIIAQCRVPRCMQTCDPERQEYRERASRMNDITSFSRGDVVWLTRALPWQQRVGYGRIIILHIRITRIQYQYGCRYPRDGEFFDIVYGADREERRRKR